MKRTSSEPDRVTLSIEDVSIEARYLFNAICGSSDGYGKSRGEVLSEIVRAKADEVFGSGHTQYLIQRCLESHEQLRTRENE